MTTAKADDKFVRVGNVRTRYRIAGSGDRAIILLHGVGGYIETWDDVMAKLADHYSVYALDLPGHGHTGTGIEDFRVNTLSDFLVGFMDAVDLKRAHLAGLSFGTCVAVGCAARHPERVDQLVLVSPAFLDGTVPLQFRIASVPVLGPWLCKRLLPESRSDVERMAKQVIHRPENRTDAWIKRTHEMISRPSNKDGFCRVGRANLALSGRKAAVFDPLDRFLEATDEEILLVHGAEDATIPLGAARLLEETISNADLIVFDDCGHEVPHERPADLTDRLREFFETTDGGPV